MCGKPAGRAWYHAAARARSGKESPLAQTAIRGRVGDAAPALTAPRAPLALAAADALYRRVVFPLLSRGDAERVHELTLVLLARLSASPAACRLVARLLAYEHPALAIERLGLRFPNPLGLAAGCDKNGIAVPAFAALGFGHVEVGTVTPVPQPGNLRPRVWRLRADAALVNAMGFPSEGAAAMAGHLARWRALQARGAIAPIPIGANLGKNKVTPIERAWDDYVRALETLYPHADYFVANISSPNTAGLRDLHAEELLRDLGQALGARARTLAPPGTAPKPLLLKLSPDLTPAQLDATLAAARAGGWSGLMLGNTTVGRAGLRDPNQARPGGVSGRPILPRTIELVRVLRREMPRDWALVAVGGVMDAEGAWALLRAGADLVQAYTGFVYGGPAFAGQVCRGLVARLAAHGCRSLAEVVGADA
ncbi:MAG TPA: quinone-dependent dihydroorotate dehydrogenase [Chloroflexota bacterium]|nr:quinone-dependent dihydroorotate dehydrogenase [Chloroflexota bacterium]